MQTKRHRIAALLAVTLATGACSGGAATSTTVAATISVPATTTAPPTTASTTSTTLAFDPIASLLQEFARTPLRATYRFGEGSDTAEVILSQDPTADPPVAAILIDRAQAKLLTIGDQTVFCDTVSTACFEIAGTGGEDLASTLLGTFAGSLLVVGYHGSPEDPAIDPESLTIAGRTAICITYIPPPESGLGESRIRQCLDSELGFTLLLETLDATGKASATVVELLEFGSPLEGDFEPTGPITPAS